MRASEDVRLREHPTWRIFAGTISGWYWRRLEMPLRLALSSEAKAVTLRWQWIIEDPVRLHTMDRGWRCQVGAR